MCYRDGAECFRDYTYRFGAPSICFVQEGPLLAGPDYNHLQDLRPLLTVHVADFSEGICSLPRGALVARRLLRPPRR